MHALTWAAFAAVVALWTAALIVASRGAKGAELVRRAPAAVLAAWRRRPTVTGRLHRRRLERARESIPAIERAELPGVVALEFRRIASRLAAEFDVKGTDIRWPGAWARTFRVAGAGLRGVQREEAQDNS